MKSDALRTLLRFYTFGCCDAKFLCLLHNYGGIILGVPVWSGPSGDCM